MWPRKRISIEEKLSELTEGLPDLFCEEPQPEANSPNKTQPDAKKEPEEYNGIDDLTYIEYKDGKEIHYRVKL